VLLIGGICLLPIVLYLPFLKEPLMRDEGFFASVAQLVLDGGLPYRDAFDNKPPLIFGWYALSFMLFGESVWAPRLLVSLLLSATTLLVYVQGRLMFSQGAALIASAAFAISIGFAAFETNANVEYFMLLPMMGALVSFTMGQRTGRLPWFALAGFMSALAVLTKTTSVFNMALLGGVLVWSVVRRPDLQTSPRGRGLRSLTAFACGSGVAAALVIMPFVLSSTFDDMFEALVWYSGDYVGDVSLTTKLWIMARAPVFFLLVTGGWALLALVGAAVQFRSGRPTMRLVVAWVASSVVAIVFAGRFYPHYDVMLLPGLALLIPAGIEELRQRCSSLPARAGVAGVLSITCAIALALNLGIYAQPSFAERHTAKFPGTPMAEWETQGPQIADWLRERTIPTLNRKRSRI
jgi:4-amino-4-deoxy-L-arabinose transferase-like glycosyltransferase